jgi:hypothetical protein
MRVYFNGLKKWKNYCILKPTRMKARKIVLADSQNKVSQKKLDSNEKYLQQLEDIKIRVPKGYREVIKNLAKEEGYDGVNPFIVALVNRVLKENGREEIPTGIREVKAK